MHSSPNGCCTLSPESRSMARMSLAPLSRRQFVASTAAAGAGAALSHITPNMLAQAVGPSELHAAPEWATRAMRWAQLTLVEDDPAHFDPAFWLDYFKRTALRRRLPQRRRLRRLLPHRGPASTIAARGSATAMSSANSSPAAANSACPCSCAPIPTRPTTTRKPRIRTGSPSTHTAIRVATGPRRRCG